MNAALPLAYLDGRHVPVQEARVPALDRGFLYGDGIYEVIPVYAGRPFGLARHLARLARSLAAIRCTDPQNAAGWTRIVDELIDANGGGQMAVYLQVTRGVTPGREHGFPEDASPTVFGMCLPMPGPSPAMLELGVSAVTAPDERWAHCDIKATSLLANVLARQRAAEAGANEAILLRDGFVTEGSTSNVMAVTGGEILTAPDGHGILPGVTRDTLHDLAHTVGLTWQPRPIAEPELRAAAEVWISSSTREVLAVTTLDGTPVGDGRPGPVWRRMYELIQAAKEQL